MCLKFKETTILLGHLFKDGYGIIVCGPNRKTFIKKFGKEN